MASSNYPQGSKENPHSLSSYDYLLKMNEWNGGWVEESSLNKYYIDGHNFAHKTQGSSLGSQTCPYTYDMYCEMVHNRI